MYAYLLFVLVFSASLLTSRLAFADTDSGRPYVEDAHRATEPIDREEAQRKLIAGSVGLVVGSVGLLTGVLLLATKDCDMSGDYCAPVRNPEGKEAAGIVLVVFSPLILTESIIGVRRNRRILKREREPREPASWRRVRD